MRASNLGVASLGFAGSLGATGFIYNAVQIFLLHKSDDKWGDEWGNFSLATTLLLFLIVGSLAGFVVVWIALRTGRLAGGTGKALQSGALSGCLAWLIAVSGLGWWARSILGVRNPSVDMAIQTGLPGVVAGVVYAGILKVSAAISSSR